MTDKFSKHYVLFQSQIIFSPYPNGKFFIAEILYYTLMLKHVLMLKIQIVQKRTFPQI